MTDKTINTYTQHEIIIERSRFITHLFPTDSSEDAYKVIKLTKKKYYDATHNCSSYVIKNTHEHLQKSNDDGEPAGTAGAPMLHALTTNNMINITAIVTRYFGGVKLGAGGLIRAYAKAVQEALQHTTLFQYQQSYICQLSLSYEELNGLYHLNELHPSFAILALQYDQTVQVQLSVIETFFLELETLLTAQFLRHIQLQKLETTINKVPLQ